MATLQQAVAAFKNAHAAGDTAAAARLARLVRSMQSGGGEAPATTAPLSREELQEPTPEGPTVLGELGRGAEQYLTSGATALSALFGDEEEAARKGIEEQQRIAEKYGEGPSLARLGDIYEREGLLSAAGSAISQIPELIAQQGAQLGGTAAATKTGAMLGSRFGPTGAIIGGGLGAVASVLPQLAGSDILRQAEETPEDINVAKAFGAAALQTAPELVGQYFTVGKGFIKTLLGIADDTGLDSSAARDITGAALAKLRGEAVAPLYRAGLRAAAVEMPTEVAQQVIERAQAGLDVLSPEAMAEYGEAMYAAGMIAGPLGTVGGVGDRRAATARLRGIAEEEKQDEFAAIRQELENQGQMELGGIEPVLSPETAAGEAQEEAARQQTLQKEEYTTRGGQQRYATPGTFAERELPTLIRDQQVFDEMKARKLTQAASLDMLPEKERPVLDAMKANMNEAAIMQRVAVEAARMPTAEGEAPLVIDPSKPISELNEEETAVLDRVLGQLQARDRQPKGKGQINLPKSYLPLVGEAATKAKLEEQQKEAEKQRKAAEAAAAASASEQGDLFSAPPSSPTAGTPPTQTTTVTAPVTPPSSVLPKDRASLRALFPGANPGLGIFSENGPLAGRDLSDPAVAAQVKSDLETAAQKYSGKNIAAVEEFLKRPEFQGIAAKPADTTTEVEETEATEAEDKTTFGMNFEITADGKRRLLTKRIPLPEEDDAVAQKLEAIEPASTNAELTDEQAAAMFFRAYEPASALRVMVAEGVPRYTETQTVNTKADARKAVRWAMQNMSSKTVEALNTHAKDFQNVLSRTKVTAKKRKISDEIKEAKAAKAAQKEESQVSKKINKAVKKLADDKKPPIDAATREALKQLDARGVQQTTALLADTAVGRSTRPADKIEEERKLESQKRMYEMMGGKVTELPYTGAVHRQVIGTKYLENASASPKLEGDLLAAVQAGDLRKTISLLTAKMSGRPEAQQILRKIQSLGLKTKIVIDGRPAPQRLPNLDPLPEEAEAVQAGVEGKSALEAANFIARTAPDPAHRVIAKAVAQRLRELEAVGTAPGFEVLHAGVKVPIKMAQTGVRGAYLPDENRVRIFGADVTGSVGTSYEVVLHELVHAVTKNLIYQGRLRSNTDAALAESATKLLDVADAVVNHFNRRVADSKRGKVKLTAFEQSMLRRNFNTLENVDEVFTWALTNPEAQAYMEGIPYRGRNTWTVFVQAVRRILRLPSSADTALSEILSVAEGYFGKSAARAATLTARSTQVGTLPEGKIGSYDPVTDTVTLHPELGLNEHTLTHEITHAALASRIADPNSEIAKEFTEFFQTIKEQLGDAYGGQDLQEFVAELMGNEEFATSLKAIKALKGGNLLQRIVQAIAEFFGFRKGTSAYDEGIKYINELLNVPANAEPTITQTLFLGNPTSATQALASINKVAKPATSKELTQTLSLLEKASSLTKELFFRAVRLDNIYNMYKDAGSEYKIFTRALKQLIDSAEKRAAFLENHIDDANKKYKAFSEVAGKYPQVMKRLFNMAERARIAGIDLVPGSGFTPSGKQLTEYAQLNSVFNNLPKPVRDMYVTMRKDYDAAYKEYREFMLKQYSDNPTLYREMRQKFEAEHPVTGYIPFMRFGDFVLEYTDPATKRRVVRQFESDTERQAAINQLSTEDYKTYTRMDEATYDPNKIPSGSFLSKAMQDLQKAKATPQQLNAVYQAYLSMFPAESIMKRMMRSDNVAGMSEDMIRAYANTMTQWARHMGNALYSPQIDEALASINTQRDVDDNTRIINKILNSEESRKFLHNPSFSKIVSSLSAVSYGAFILGNVASAVINLSSLPLLGLPILAGRYGYGDAAATLGAATKLVTPVALKDMVGTEDVWSTLPAKYKKLFAALNDHGQLQHTQTREVLAGRQKETEIETNPLRKIGLAAMDYGSRPFSATEKVNRAAMAVAAYDLATKGGNGVKPMSEAAAIEYALGVVKDVNTSGMAVTGPQLFQTPVGRVFGTFKTFAWNAAFVVAKSFRDSVKGATPEIRKAALSQFLGTMVISGALSGVSGMPFVMMVTTAARAILAAMFGDDEEDEKYITTEEWARDFVGTLLWKGPLNYYTNLALADRMAITSNLLFREDPKLIDDVGYVRAALLQSVGGPALGYFGNVSDGLKLWGEGHYERALEQILPSAIANVFKGYRFLQDKGALTKDGKVIKEDVTTYSAVMQAMGIAPADLSDLMIRRGQAMDVQEKARKRKDQLLDLMWAARQSGDDEEFEEARLKLLELGKQHPGMVKVDTIQRSFRNQAANIRDSVTGLTLDASIRNELIRRFDLEN